MVFDVKTDKFEGPIDVLYKLIVSHDLDLNELSLSLIVDEFVAVVNKMDQFDLERVTEFTLIASILVELKSRRLLPEKESLLGEEDLLLFEERDLLLSRLVDCRTFREVSKLFAKMMEESSSRYGRKVGKNEKFSSALSDLLEDVVPADLIYALMKIKRDRQPKIQHVDLSHVSASPRISIEEAFASITRELTGRQTISFKELVKGYSQPIDIVVFFLATLELYKIGIVELEQFKTFGELKITLNNAPNLSFSQIVASESIDTYDAGS